LLWALHIVIKQQFFNIYICSFSTKFTLRIVSAKCCCPLLWQGCKFVWLAVHSVPVPQLVNFRYTVVQLRPKRSLLVLHRNNIRALHARTSNEKFLVFSPSYYSVSTLTSSPLLSCHSGSTATTEIWRPIDFSKLLPRTLNTTSGFVFVDVLAFRRSKFVNKPNFVDLNGQHI